MNLLKLNDEYRPIYWVSNFLSDDEIDRIKTHARTLIALDAQVGEPQKEKKNLR